MSLQSFSMRVIFEPFSDFLILVSFPVVMNIVAIDLRI